MKCKLCNGCFETTRVSEEPYTENLYLVCKLDRIVYVANRKGINEVTDELEKEKVFATVNMKVL